MTRVKVLVISDDHGEESRAELAAALDRLGARATRLDEADAVAVVLHRTSGGALAHGLSLERTDRRVTEIREALGRKMPVTPVLWGSREVLTPFELPDSIEDLQFRIALPLPSSSALPEVAAELVAVAIRPRRPAEEHSERQPSAAPEFVFRLPSFTSLRQPARESVFVSYRRDDTGFWARELAKELSAILGPGRVFFDVGSGSPGFDFRRLIDDAMSRSSVVAVVVGTSYLTTDPYGNRRIDDQYDWVRAEVRAAIEAGKPIRMVLVGSAVAPDPGDLPPDLRALADAAPTGSIRTGEELRRIVDGILGGTRTGKMLEQDLAGGATRGFGDAMREVRPHAAIREGLGALGWSLQHPEDLSLPQILYHDRHPNYRFELAGDDRLVVLEEHSGRRWVRRERFSMHAGNLEPTGVMRLEPRLVEAAVVPGAYLDRTGREKLPRKPEWPGALDPLHYNLVARKPLPMTLDAWNETRRYLGGIGGTKPLGPARSIVLQAGYGAKLRFMPDRERLVAMTTEWVELIDVRSGDQITSRGKRHGPSWTALDVGADGRVALGSYGGRIVILNPDLDPLDDIALPRRWVRVAGRKWPSREIGAVCWSSSQEMVAAVTTTGVWILDVASRAFVHCGHPAFGIDVIPRSVDSVGARFLGESHELVVHDHTDVWIVDTSIGEVDRQLEPTWLPSPWWKNAEVPDAHWPRRLLGLIRAAVPSPGGDVVALAGADGQIGFVDPATMSVVRVCVWHTPTTESANDVGAVAFGPTGSQLATVASSNLIIIGDVKTGRPVSSARAGAPLGINLSLSWASDGKYLALGGLMRDNAALVWDLEHLGDEANPST